MERSCGLRPRVLRVACVGAAVSAAVALAAQGGAAYAGAPARGPAPSPARSSAAPAGGADAGGRGERTAAGARARPAEAAGRRPVRGRDGGRGRWEPSAAAPTREGPAGVAPAPERESRPAPAPTGREDGRDGDPENTGCRRPWASDRHASGHASAIPLCPARPAGGLLLPTPGVVAPLVFAVAGASDGVAVAPAFVARPAGPPPSPAGTGVPVAAGLLGLLLMIAGGLLSARRRAGAGPPRPGPRRRALAGRLLLRRRPGRRAAAPHVRLAWRRDRD